MVNKIPFSVQAESEFMNFIHLGVFLFDCFKKP